MFDKLNLGASPTLVVLEAPASFEPALATLTGRKIVRDLARVREVGFALAFAMERSAVDRLAHALTAKAPGDPILWFAYPKGTSTRYRCDFNRDTGWGVLTAAGFTTVRQVAIDEDWSALRFRRVEYVKNSTRRDDGRC